MRTVKKYPSPSPVTGCHPLLLEQKDVVKILLRKRLNAWLPSSGERWDVHYLFLEKFKMFELAVQATLSPWSLPPTELWGWDTVLASWRVGGGGSQHSILRKLCHLHKYFKYFRYPPAICFSCIHVPFSRYFLCTLIYPRDHTETLWAHLAQ
jgi:hypothetical protein